MRGLRPDRRVAASLAAALAIVGCACAVLFYLPRLDQPDLAAPPLPGPPMQVRTCHMIDGEDLSGDVRWGEAEGLSDEDELRCVTDAQLAHLRRTLGLKGR